jgi:hypothetical protein
MVNLKQFHSKTGLRTCYISNGKIIDSYLLTDEELNKITDLSSFLDSLPEGFTIGVVEIESGEKYCIVKAEEGFLVSPVDTENIGELYRKIISAGGFGNDS